jgi:hypothetical protein
VVVLAEVPWASRVWALPFLSALAPSERYAKDQGQRHKSLTEWAFQLLLLVRRWYPEREIVAVADSTYASLKLLERCRKLRNPITFITRLRLDAALYEPAPPRRPGQMGRPRLKSERLPNLSVVAEDPTTVWRPLKVAGWYSSAERTVEIVSDSAIWYSTGLPAVPLRWVLIRDPQGEFKTQAPCCALTLLPNRSRSSRGSSGDGRRKPPFKRYASARGSRLGGSGLRKLSGALLRRCWAFSPWSRSLLTDEWHEKARAPSAERLGMTSRLRRSPML